MCIFSYFVLFSFFIWSCSVLMMQLRCESAAAQGLRSDVLQATKMPESAGLHPEPPFPLALWLWTSPHLRPASLPKSPLPSPQYIIYYICCSDLRSFDKTYFPQMLLTSGPEIMKMVLLPSWVSRLSQSGRRSVEGMLVCSWYIRPVKTRSSETRPAQVKRSREMQCVAGTHDARAWTCCACITGTITYRKCPTSEVVK